MLRDDTGLITERSVFVRDVELMMIFCQAGLIFWRLWHSWAKETPKTWITDVFVLTESQNQDILENLSLYLNIRGWFRRLHRNTPILF